MSDLRTGAPFGAEAKQSRERGEKLGRNIGRASATTLLRLGSKVVATARFSAGPRHPSNDDSSSQRWANHAPDRTPAGMPCSSHAALARRWRVDPSATTSLRPKYLRGHGRSTIEAAHRAARGEPIDVVAIGRGTAPAPKNVTTVAVTPANGLNTAVRAQHGARRGRDERRCGSSCRRAAKKIVAARIACPARMGPLAGVTTRGVPTMFHPARRARLCRSERLSHLRQCARMIASLTAVPQSGPVGRRSSPFSIT